MSITARTVRLHAGFTLIEAVIVVAIVGILAAVAYPAIFGNIAKTKRGAAAGCLSEYAQFLERNYTLALRYDLDVDGKALTLPGKQCATDLTGAYAFALVDPKESTFSLTATPSSGQKGVDTRCGCVLSLDQMGTKGVSACSKTVADCW